MAKIATLEYKGSLKFMILSFLNTPSVTTPAALNSAFFRFFLLSYRLHHLQQTGQLQIQINEANLFAYATAYLTIKRALTNSLPN
jgi:hypothetical protein